MKSNGETLVQGLASITQMRLTGEETIRGAEPLPGMTVKDFWAWSSSDLVSNTTRGILAEYLVAVALGVSDGIREEWAPFDLLTNEGTKVEVKSAAYVQAWKQTRLSRITFSIAPTREWITDQGRSVDEPKRQAAVYVFALLAETDPEVLNPLDTSQWDFYVLPTRMLDERARSQHSITLSSLARLTDQVSYDRLAVAVELASSS